MFPRGPKIAFDAQEEGPAFRQRAFSPWHMSCSLSHRELRGHPRRDLEVPEIVPSTRAMDFDAVDVEAETGHGGRANEPAVWKRGRGLVQAIQQESG